MLHSVGIVKWYISSVGGKSRTFFSLGVVENLHPIGEWPCDPEDQQPVQKEARTVTAEDSFRGDLSSRPFRFRWNI